ncbi:MAG: hypothetical protein M3378_03650, partial [Actinomycetota bacterium]|nr:hypothetical protein [Actinomycetota bacterium]
MTALGTRQTLGRQNARQGFRFVSSDPGNRRNFVGVDDKENPMAGMIQRSFGSPEEVRPFEEDSG